MKSNKSKICGKLETSKKFQTKLLSIGIVLMLLATLIVFVSGADDIPNVANVNQITGPKIFVQVDTEGVAGKKSVDLTVELVNDHPTYSLDGKVRCVVDNNANIKSAIGGAGAGAVYTKDVVIPAEGQDYLELTIISDIPGKKLFQCYFTGLVTKRGEHGETLYVTYDNTFSDKKEEGAPFAGEVSTDVMFNPEPTTKKSSGFTLILALGAFVTAAILVNRKL